MTYTRPTRLPSRVEMIAWVVTFILVTGLAAVAVAIVAMSEVARG